VQINNDPGTPRNMQEALAGPEAEQWRNGLFEEYDNFFKKRSAWKFQKLPKGKRVIGTKNVLKKTFNDPKANGGTRYKLRNVLLGYQQIPGVDFSESHSPTPRDSSIRMALALALYFGDVYEEELLEEGDEWIYTNVIDVEAAFLESKLAFPMYIKFSEYFEEYCEARGVVIPDDVDCLEVGMSQYGSCHASRDWFNLAVLSCTLRITEGLIFSVIVTEFRYGTVTISESLKLTNMIQKFSVFFAIISVKSHSITKILHGGR